MDIMLDAEDSLNIASSRSGSGGLIVQDTLPPGSSEIMMVMTPKLGANKYGLSMSARVHWNSTAKSASYVPPLESDNARSDEGSTFAILAVHQSIRLGSRVSLMNLTDLVSETTDPYALSILMQANMQQQLEITKLVSDYVAAGIEQADALIIATEEVNNMYL